MRTGAKTRATTSRAYVERVNLAIDYVEGHLGERLRLEAVARAAHLSPCHFHRVFRMMVGMTLAEFVKRVRLERALFLMAHGRRASLTSIALACGFSSSSDFSRSFRQRFGRAPSSLDLGAWRAAHRAVLEGAAPALRERSRVHGPGAASNPDGFRVRLRELPARTVAYIRVLNPYRTGAVVGAAERLVAWAERRGVAGGQWLGYQWEDPEITPLEECRYHVAVEAEEAAARGEVGRFRFPAMLVAEVEVRGGIDVEIRALQWLYGTWLPRSGYVPDDQPCFEAWHGKPFAYGMERFELRVQLPVKKDGWAPRHGRTG